MVRRTDFRFRFGVCLIYYYIDVGVPRQVVCYLELRPRCVAVGTVSRVVP